MSAADAVLKPDFAARRKHFIFTDEHEALRESIRAFVVKELAPHAEEWEETTFPDWVFKRMGELGFLGLDKPEEYGGQGGDYYSSLVLAEEIVHARSGGLAMGLAVQTDMAMPPILAFGTEEQKREWVVPAIAGDAILCLGITEPDAGSDVAGIKTRAVRDGDEYVINGSKTFITNGGSADLVVVAARTSPEKKAKGISLFGVDTSLPGFSVGRVLDKVGQDESDTAELSFEDVRVSNDDLVGPLDTGFISMMQFLPQERLGSAVTNLAHAAQILVETIQYAKDRQAFGQPIGSFQHNRFLIAEMATEARIAQVFVDDCIRKHLDGKLDATLASMAKWWTTELQKKIVDQAVQLHGGYGYMMEYRVARDYVDSRIQTIFGGTTEIMKEIIGRDLGL